MASRYAPTPILYAASHGVCSRRPGPLKNSCWWECWRSARCGVGRDRCHFCLPACLCLPSLFSILSAVLHTRAHCYHYGYYRRLSGAFSCHARCLPSTGRFLASIRCSPVPSLSSGALGRAALRLCRVAPYTGRCCWPAPTTFLPAQPLLQGGLCSCLLRSWATKNYCALPGRLSARTSSGGHIPLDVTACADNSRLFLVAYRG